MKTMESSAIFNDDTDGAEKLVSRERLPEPVYYIESPDDDTVLVGINVTINHDASNLVAPTTVSWYDTTRERIMSAEATERDEKHFAFRRAQQEGGGLYYFSPMDVDIYNSKVRPYAADGAEATNQETLIKDFLKTLEESE